MRTFRKLFVYLYNFHLKAYSALKGILPRLLGFVAAAAVFCWLSTICPVNNCLPALVGLLLSNKILSICCVPGVTAVVLIFIPNRLFREMRVFVMGASLVTCVGSQLALVSSQIVVGPLRSQVYP